MIIAFSNIKGNGLKIKEPRKNKNNQYTINLTKPIELKQISFKGNIPKISKNFLEDLSHKLGKKITKIAEEAAESTKVFLGN